MAQQTRAAEAAVRKRDHRWRGLLSARTITRPEGYASGTPLIRGGSGAVPASAPKAGAGIPGKRIAGAVLAALSLVSVAACGSDSDAPEAKEPAPATSSAAAPTPSKSVDPTAASKAAVLAVYGHYWVEQVKAYAKADTKGTDLRKYATKDALGQSIANTLRLKQGGTIMRGAPTSDAKVTSIDLDKKTAVIRDCLDVARWETVDKKTGKALPPLEGVLTRYETIAKAEKWGAQWLITELKPRKTGC